jgi:uncharacterized protein YndB with AHSA1/START domain
MGSKAATESRVLVLERVFDAPPQVVFEAWTRPEHIVNWWGPVAFTMPHCELDFRVGGSFRFNMRAPDGSDHWVSGRYQEITPPEAIAFTWVREDQPGKVWCRTSVHVTFADEGGRTRFRLRQSLFETPAYCEEHRGGWSQTLGRLDAYVQELTMIPGG